MILIKFEASCVVPVSAQQATTVRAFSFRCYFFSLRIISYKHTPTTVHRHRAGMLNGVRYLENNITEGKLIFLFVDGNVYMADNNDDFVPHTLSRSLGGWSGVRRW